MSKDKAGEKEAKELEKLEKLDHLDRESLIKMTLLPQAKKSENCYVIVMMVVIMFYFVLVFLNVWQSTGGWSGSSRYPLSDTAYAMTHLIYLLMLLVLNLEIASSWQHKRTQRQIRALAELLRREV